MHVQQGMHLSSSVIEPKSFSFTTLAAFAFHSSSVEPLMDYFLLAPLRGSAGVRRLARLKFLVGKIEPRITVGIH